MEAAATIDELVDEFSFLDDWEERYRHVIELGKTLPGISDSERTDANKVKGCVSQVWLVSDGARKPETRLSFRGDSDAHIVRGLAALLARLYSGRSPEDVLALEVEELLARIGLAEHISPQRSNGLHAMIARIRKDAQTVLETSAKT